MSGERYSWRSSPGVDPVQLPAGWARSADAVGEDPSRRSRLTRAFMTRVMKDDAARTYFEAERLAKHALWAAQRVAALRAAGATTESATLVEVRDTGGTINDDPVVVLTVDADAGPREFAALVPRIAIPRPSELIAILRDQGSTTPLYAGLAPRS